MQLPIYFFGDNHFSPTPSLSNDKKIKKLEEFINSLEENKGSIFIMGDFFDYYFEYKKNNPDYFDDIFSMLDKIKKTGFEIYFLAGNHDYWIGDKFRSYTTKSFLVDQTISIGAKKIYVTHGDGILSWDKGYRLLKTILRSRIFNFFYSMLPKSLALSIAKKISYERKDSHQVNNALLEKIHNELIQFSRKEWGKGADLVIMGHYHHSFHYSENNKELIIIDDCSENKFNYIKYDGQSVTVNSI
jgi:UDP-2,3-diacylglucosamine hydrolase